jgi:hypothetical protein
MDGATVPINGCRAVTDDSISSFLKARAAFSFSGRDEEIAICRAGVGDGEAFKIDVGGDGFAMFATFNLKS